MNIQERNTKTAQIVMAYLVVYFVWGSTFFFIEKALRSFPPFVLGSLRFVTAGALLLSYCILKGYKLYIRKEVMQAALIGFMLLFIDMAAIIWSEQYISSGIVVIISSAAAIWFVIFDRRKWKENFTSIPIVTGLILGFGGVFLLFAEQIFSGSPSQGDNDRSLLAMIVITLGTIGWTIGSLYSKYSQEKNEEKAPNETEHLNVIVKTAWQMLVAGAVFTLIAVFNNEYSNFDYRIVYTADWLALGYLIIMGSILAFSCYLWLLQERPATEVSTYAYVNPIIALILAHLFTDHIVTSIQILGLITVLLSVLLMNWNLYMNKRTLVKIRKRKPLKRLRHMALKSSIPRISEVSEYENRRQTYRDEEE